MYFFPLYQINWRVTEKIISQIWQNHPLYFCGISDGGLDAAHPVLFSEKLNNTDPKLAERNVNILIPSAESSCLVFDFRKGRHLNYRELTEKNRHLRASCRGQKRITWAYSNGTTCMTVKQLGAKERKPDLQEGRKTVMHPNEGGKSQLIMKTRKYKWLFLNADNKFSFRKVEKWLKLTQWEWKKALWKPEL